MAGRVFIILIASAVSAVVLMAWGFVFWTVLPFQKSHLLTLPEEDSIAAAVRDSGAEPGVYVYPGPDGMDPKNEAAFSAWEKKHVQGPVMHIFVAGDGIEPMAPSIYGQGMAHFFVSSLIAGCLLAVVSGSLRSYISRAAFVAGIGLFAAVAVRLSDVVWFYHDLGYQLMMAGYLISSWILAGLVLAAFIRPTRQAIAT